MRQQKKDCQPVGHSKHNSVTTTQHSTPSLLHSLLLHPNQSARQSPILNLLPDHPPDVPHLCFTQRLRPGFHLQVCRHVLLAGGAVEGRDASLHHKPVPHLRTRKQKENGRSAAAVAAARVRLKTTGRNHTLPACRKHTPAHHNRCKQHQPQVDSTQVGPCPPSFTQLQRHALPSPPKGHTPAPAHSPAWLLRRAPCCCSVRPGWPSVSRSCSTAANREEEGVAATGAHTSGQVLLACPTNNNSQAQHAARAPPCTQPQLCLRQLAQAQAQMVRAQAQA